MEQIGQFLTANSTLVLVMLGVLLLLLVAVLRGDKAYLEQLLTSVFLDVEKRFKSTIIEAGHDKIEAAVEQAMLLIPRRFDIALSIVAFALGVSREDLAHTIAQRIYDRARGRVAKE